MEKVKEDTAVYHDTVVEKNSPNFLAHPCPTCAKNIDPKTGNPRYNAETVAAIEEGIAISCGKIPAKRFPSLADMLEDLDRDDEND